jgi:hypothetical protein
MMTRYQRAVMSSMAALAMMVTVGTVFTGQAQAESTPRLTVVAAHPSGRHGYVNGEAVNISIGANHLFKPYSHVNILECADPKGKKSKLPKNDSTCDGNTIQGNTVLVAKNGSFSEKNYLLYSLPNTVLGEQGNQQPVCNTSRPCVLYVGANQNSFTAPKLFSLPMVIVGKKLAK